MAAISGFNWFLIALVVVVALLMIVVAVYTLLHYQHPEDRNQAWWPKIVVILSIWLSVCTVLFFPIDVANRLSCNNSIPVNLCQFAIPATQIWYVLMIANVAVVYLVIPFTIFFYESDQDHSLIRRVCTGTIWVVGFIVVMALLLGLLYYFAGYVEYEVIGLTSGLLPLDQTQVLTQCIPPASNSSAVNACDGTEVNYSVASELYRTRVSLPVYLICLNTVVGWLLFMLYGGVGLASFPFDMLREFAGRPRKVITKSEYIRRARELGLRAIEIKELASNLRAEERSGALKGRKYRNTVKELNRQLVLLEEDEEELGRVYPQGDDPDVTWTFIVIKYWVKLFVGILGVVGSLLWIVQIILYVMISPPVTGFLNNLFLAMNSPAGMFFAVVIFGAFSLYLLLCTMAGSFKLGITFVFFSLYPMKAGATLMNSMLFNCALVLLATPAVVSFCATAFSGLASGSAVSEIYIAQAQNLLGFRYLFAYNVFVYGLVAFFFLTCIYLLIRGPSQYKKRVKEDAYRFG
mmetsp:Transcript_2284/g.6699  ORF Transcript_2284/g.6699 Transcript_2284/m.6699 type:complete len:520 (-) Transcript_2284:178-1737(-)